MRKLIFDTDFLSKSCKDATLEEGKEIAIALREELKRHQAIGIAANQIGIQKRVCLINVGREIILINPKIIKSSGEIGYVEACLSFPAKNIMTRRFATIVVKADNHEEELNFSTNNLLECVCVQHEIDHLNGITMFDRQHKKKNYLYK
tara:strand:+ start:2203 stop:2646 length:444 start_codon:yes stop_codon:yes gene_type:complete